MRRGEKACEIAQSMGAKNAKMLNVSGAFHSPYMAQAGEALSFSNGLPCLERELFKLQWSLRGKCAQWIRSMAARSLEFQPCPGYR